MKRLTRPNELVVLLTNRAAHVTRVRDQRGGVAAVPSARPIVERWPELRRKLITQEIERAIREHYKGPTSGLGSRVVGVRTENAVAASGYRQGKFFRPRRVGRKKYPDYHDWEWEVAVRTTWWRDVIKRLGTCVVEGELILDAQSQRHTALGELVDVRYLHQSRGNSIRVEVGQLYRAHAGHPWWLCGGNVTQRWLTKRRMALTKSVMTD